MKQLKGIKTSHAKLKLIGVSEGNYFSLRARGKMGNTFNDVITELLKLGGQEETA